MPKKKGSASLPLAPHEIIKDYRLAYQLRQASVIGRREVFSGSLFAMPIINQPQCSILGIGALQKRAVIITDSLGDDSIAIRPMVYLSFVFDHRILGGASADWFLAKVKEILENWS